MKAYDVLVVGAGLYGAVFAERMKVAGKRVLVIEKRNHIAGNAYTEDVEGIAVHRYGAHIFHTNDRTVWNYVNRFADFNRYTNSPVANYKGKLFSLPFSMYTFNAMWGVTTPEEAAEKIGVPFIDMTSVTEAYLAGLGDFASRPLYVYPKDNSHLQMQGAVAMAGFLADGLLSLGSPYADLLVSRNAKIIDEDTLPSEDPYMVREMGEAVCDPTLNLDAFQNEKQD